MASTNAQFPTLTVLQKKPDWNVCSVILWIVFYSVCSSCFWDIHSFTCGVRDRKCVCTLPPPGWRCSGVEQRSGLSLLQSKWHVPVSKFLFDSPHLPAGSQTAFLDITSVWPLFHSGVAAFSIEGLCISWLHSPAGSKLVVDLITHVSVALELLAVFACSTGYGQALLNSLLRTGNLRILNHCRKEGISFCFLQGRKFIGI